MDISALSSALGAPVETVGQVTGEAGFEAVLEQADPAGFIPPGAPPGPEPPPDILVAGEEVEVAEPNAQPQKLDFHPLQKVEIDVELPKPFWEPSLKAESADSADVAAKSPESVDQAMNWLVGQMSGGFFSQPILPPDCPTPNADITIPKGKPDLKSQVDPTCVVGPFPGVDGQKPLTSNQIAGATDTYLKSEANGSKPTSNPQLSSASSTAADVATLVEEDILVGVGFEKIEPVCEYVGNEVKPSETSDILTKHDPAKERDKSAFGSKPNDDPKPVGDPIPTPNPNNGERPKARRRVDGQKEAPLQVNGEKDKTASSPLSSFNRKADNDKSTALNTVADVAEEIKPEMSSNGDRSAFSKSDKSLGSIVGEVNKKDLLTYKFELEETEVDTATSISTPVVPSNVLTVEAKPPSLTSEESDLVLKQVEDKLHLLAAARPRNGVTIHLNPDNLGSITVVIKSVGRMVDTQITASDPRVSEALDQNRTRLVEAMDSRGFQLQTVTVTQQSGHSTQQDSNRGWQQSNQQSQNQSQSGQSHSHRGQGDRQFDQPKANIRAWVRRGEGVDLAI